MQEKGKLKDHPSITQLEQNLSRTTDFVIGEPLSLGARHAYDFWIFLQRILGKKIPVSTSYHLQLMAWFKRNYSKSRRYDL